MRGRVPEAHLSVESLRTRASVPLGSSGCVAGSRQRANATSPAGRGTRAGEGRLTGLGVARATPPDTELLHELVGLILGDLDVVVVKVASFGGDQR